MLVEFPLDEWTGGDGAEVDVVMTMVWWWYTIVTIYVKSNHDLCCQMM